jgi:hypothetical protein
MQNDDTEDGPAHDLEFLCGEDSFVLKKNRYLDKTERKIVYDQRSVECLKVLLVYFASTIIKPNNDRVLLACNECIMS